VSASGEKPLERVKKKKRATSLSCASLCREATLQKKFYYSTLSYIRVHSIVYLKYLLGFVIHLVGEENNALLILKISKRTCGVPINFY